MANKAWIITVSMGYGHQRTAYSLRHLAEGGGAINVDEYPGIPAKDRKAWNNIRSVYEFVSRLKKVPFAGGIAFSIMDRFQKIPNYYPQRDLSKPTLQLKQTYAMIKKGWGRHLIEELKSKNAALPLISTFFTPAFMAEFFNYPGEIFCIICDSDVSRAWAPLEPKNSRIKYFAPTERVASRLKMYGVKPENIFLTGYPLLQNIVGGESMDILKEDFKLRLPNLDPAGKYRGKYSDLAGDIPEKSDHPLTLMFAVGGAGAQKEIGVEIARSLAPKIKAGELRFILVAGIKNEVKEYFERKLKNINAEILFEKNIGTYFERFGQALRKTDILWTKPSEISFYSALGLPIVVAPTIGSQEEFNMDWLLESGFGLRQQDPRYVHQWLFDWLEKGYLAEAAVKSFVNGKKMGTINIEKICCGL